MDDPFFFYSRQFDFFSSKIEDLEAIYTELEIDIENL